MAASYWQERFERGDQDAADIRDEFQNMLRGIQMYLSHDYVRKEDHLDVFYDSGAARIMRLDQHNYGVGKPVLLLVPSLINKSHIFDLTAQRSMLRYFCSQGIDAYLLDWGAFLNDPNMQDLDGVVAGKLQEIIVHLAKESGRPIHALGYCMGGTLLAGLLATHDAPITSLTFMAAPWDFHAGSQSLLKRVQFWSPSMMSSLKEGAALDVDWLQILFASLYPEHAMKKFAKFSSMDQESDDAEIFVAVEDWLNDGVPLTPEVAQECVNDWFLRNTIVGREWNVKGDVVDAANIQVPSLVVASSCDTLVEQDSALALYVALNNAKFLDPKCGHVGMIAGARAVEDVWAPIADWVHENA